MMTMWLITVESCVVSGLLITSVVLVRRQGYNRYLRTRILQDNTVGSRLRVDRAYIAGFLDGDGSVMLQIKHRKDGKSKIRFMATICFYQDTRHEKDLFWIKKILGIGYLSRRNDGMTELRVNGFETVKEVLKNLMPYIRFKKIQTKALFESCVILSKTKLRMLGREQLVKLVDRILVIQQENYVTKKKKTRGELLQTLGLTP